MPRISLWQYEKDLREADRLYQEARCDHALYCRIDGETYRQIADRLGIKSSGMIRNMAERAQRRIDRGCIRLVK